MIIEVKTVRSSSLSSKPKRVIVYVCDQCKRQYEGKFQTRFLTNRKFHLCSSECLGLSRAKGGVACEFQLSCRDIAKWHENLKATVRVRYGVDNVSSLESIKKKKVATFQKRYGVDNPLQIPDVKRRVIESHASNNPFNWISKPEARFRKLLNEFFGPEHVKIQRLIEGHWSVDFYISSINTYVQFDGVYWHGLDRPIEEIAASNSRRDKAIYEKWLKDRKLDVYVLEHGMKLVRITDKEHLVNPMMCIQKILGAS